MRVPVRVESRRQPRCLSSGASCKGLFLLLSFEAESLTGLEVSTQASLASQPALGFFLFLPPGYEDCKPTPSCLAFCPFTYVLWGIEFRSLCLQSKHFSN